MSELKTKKTTGSVAALLASVPDPKRRKDAQALQRLMEDVTGLPATLWGTSIVGFGSYHYKYASAQEGDWPLVGFSPRKQNLVLYIMPGFTTYADLLGKLGKHKTGRSCLYLNALDDVHQPTLKKLVRESVKHMKLIVKQRTAAAEAARAEKGARAGKR